MAEIIKVYREQLPALRFIGTRYTAADCDAAGGFASRWQDWFAGGRFQLLEALGGVPGVDNGYIGLMRCNMADFENTFEYWIGMFLPAGTAPPPGFETADLPAGDAGVCWIQGPDDAALYDMHDAFEAALARNGMGSFWKDGQDRVCFFERYNCPRFTEPDARGNVILDYGALLAR